jgi:transcription antitermination factor NusG
MPPGRRWYVVQAKGRREAAAGQHLQRRGVEVFFPQLLLPRYLGHARETVPMFPGYLFVRLVLPDQFDAVRWSPGVRRFVSASGQAAAVLDDGVVEFLRRNATPDGVVEARPNVDVGDRVRINGGPFDGLVAVIQRPPDARGRVKVLMELLTGRIVAARLPVQQLAGGWLA